MKKQSFSKLALLGLATGLVASASLSADSPVNTGREIARGGCGANTCGAQKSSTRDRRYNPVAENGATTPVTPATPDQQPTAPQSSCAAKQKPNGNGQMNGQGGQANSCSGKSSCSGQNGDKHA